MTRATDPRPAAAATPTANTTVPALSRAAAPPLWRNISFMLMWTSVAASGFGDRLIQLAAWAMLGVPLAGSDAASIQAGVSFFFFLPYVLLGPPSGWLADTLPRKWIMLFCDEARAAVLLLAFLLVPAGAAVVIPGDHHWKVYAIIAAVGVLAALFSPAKAATIPQVVTLRQLQPANAIVLGIAVIASLIGFIIGGPLIEKVSLRAGLIVAVLTYAISGLFFAFMRVRHHAPKLLDKTPPSQWQRLADAVRYVHTHKPIRDLIVLSVIFWAAATVLMATIAALCKTRYGIASGEVISHTSAMMATMGAGMLASSLWVAWMNSRRESSWFLMIGLFLTGLFMLALAVNRSYSLGLALVWATGFWGNTAMICVATLTQSLTPDYTRGRVFGVRDLFNTLTAVIVNFIIWQLPHADRYMTPALIATAAVLAAVALWGLWTQITSGPFTHRGQNVAWRLCRAYTLVWHRLQWVGRENVPTTGPVILAANHTTGLDPSVIQAAVPRVVRWVMLKSYRFAALEPLWRVIEPITIDQNGSNTAQIRVMLRTLKDAHAVGIFPEGGAQRDTRRLKPFQPGIGLLARRSGAPIVPVWVHGTPQTKSMLWHFLKPSKTTVLFGQPFTPDKSTPHQQVADELRRRMLELAKTVQ